ncbi:leucyl/phenylalanyl-tRNA--protein transferase [Egibacter rhizosphaerae]|uniref:Leucyl/phenylalanyl-tRNA--protein transferase n=1 Tax=Egibacter rhizosphaerae TaxID=1670831 RepID=A0A411YKI6_9ACTN|nr:leucyl/phenylalanyl-tRNA--protein transferase [Egibacter rhizosphaerae]QBI21691.1 leucyl/phenylalanyl-tRNA--protein transferase [Egibacter rhizosphaerae]
MRHDRAAEPTEFPDARLAPGDAPLAFGGAITPSTLAAAYRRGIFPWPVEGTTTWWSPDPRGVLPLEALRVSRSLRRTLRRAGWRCTTDTATAAVIAECASGRPEGTWITPEMAEAYDALRHSPVGRTAVHSVEVWDTEGGLVGGLYGVAVGAVFSGESMFHRATDASKVALVDLVRRLGERGFELIDVQLPTRHLASLGARTVRRSAFLAEIERLRDVATGWPLEAWEPATDHEAVRGLRGRTTR